MDQEDRVLSDWEFPVRVVEAPDGTLTITNSDEMIARRDRFLDEGGIPEEACGSHIFTWTFVLINCEPELVLETVRSFTIQPPALANGASYAHELAIGAGTLLLLGEEADGTRTYSATMPINGSSMREERAEADAIIGQYRDDPVTVDEAMQRREGDTVEGTITVTLEADASGTVLRREDISNYVYTEADGSIRRGRVEQVYTRTLR